MNQQIHKCIDEFRTNPSDNNMHNLIELGEDALPCIVAAWRNENNFIIRNNFWEVLSEMPNKETVPLFEQKLSSLDQEELRFAVLGLFRFDALRYEAQILKAIHAHPTLSTERSFIDYIERGLEADKRRKA